MWKAWLVAGACLTILCGCRGGSDHGGKEAKAPTSKQAAAPAAKAAAPLRGASWATVKYPMGCSPVGYAILKTADVELNGDNNKDAVVLVACNAGTESPPVALYAFDGASSASKPRLMARLLSENADRQATAFTVDGRTIRMTVHGFSSDHVPRCCPDETFSLTWTWHGTSGYTFTSQAG